MKRTEYIAAWSASHSTKSTKFVIGFISLVYYLARIAIKLKLNPNRVTVLGGIIGLSAALMFANQMWLPAAAIAILSSLFDGVDGAVAQLTNQKSKFGAILDVVTDRVVELSWFLALLTVGANVEAVISLTLLIMLMEYLRPKANSLGIVGAGSITIAERPTRVIMFAMLSVAMYVLGSNAQVATAGAWVMGSITLISAGWLFFGFTNQLRNNSG